MRHDTRAVSAPVGITLMLAIVLAGMTLVVVIGTAALDDTRMQMDVERAEKTLTQLDSQSAMVALGETDQQSVPLADAGAGGYRVTPDTGWMNVTVVNESAGWTKPLLNQSMGAVLYENRNTTLAYQGGGVWKRTEAGAVMISPPEFHYREATLTLPIISIAGDTTLDGTAALSKTGATSVEYPNATKDPEFVNPLRDGHINVTVHSAYYRAWGRYFETRTDGNVTYDHARNTATAMLVVPFDESYENILASTESGGITINGNDDPPEPSETGVNYPLPDSHIRDNIKDCTSDPTACTNYSAGTVINSSGTYYTDEYFSGTLNVTDPGGNVTLIVNENFSPDEVIVDMSGNNLTTILVRRSFDMGANNYLNYDGPADHLAVAVHSDGAVNGNGKYKFRGVLYAPGSDCDLNGGGGPSWTNLEGAVVCETITINGNPNKFQEAPSVEDTDIDLGSEAPKITYLHVTTDTIAVEGD